MRAHRFIRFVNLFILVALIFAPLTPAVSTQASRTEDAAVSEMAPDRLLARWQDGYAFGQEGLESLGVTAARPLFAGQDLPASLGQIVVLELPRGSDVLAMAESLGRDPRFAWVEPDYLAYPAQSEGVNEVPDDPLYTEQWGLTQIEAPAAWDVHTGDQTVVIAIIDSGLDRTHPDLLGQLWVNPGEVPGNGIDEDNNTYIDDVYGWDFVSDDNDPADDHGHGTQVAGVAAADSDNGLGVAGTCWGCRLMAVKVMSGGGVANYSDIALGVVYAAQKGAQVINISLGGYSYSSTLLAAIQSVVNTYRAVVVAGAGNDDTDVPLYPAAYDEVIAVTGTDESDLKSGISNYGAWVDLTAPAVDIQTTFSGGGYGAVDGTSVAAPFVSGVAGLLFSQYADWSNDLVRAQLEHTADSLDLLNPGYEGLLGFGRVNAGGALSVAPAPLIDVVELLVNGDPLGRPVPGESATLEIRLGNDWLEAQGVTGVLSTTDAYTTITQDTADFGDLPAGGSATGSPAYTFDVASEAGYDHAIPFTVQVSANGGAYSTALDFTIRTRSAEELVGGTIATNTTWTNDKTYVVTSNVGVAPGYTLTIEPGTTVEFNATYSLNVGGRLIADGTEEQPIRFISYDGSAWGRIYFDDPSIDAQADTDGNYLSGNILRWVAVQGAGSGIGCNSATPYLSHVTTGGGGMNCSLGSTSFWLLDSELSGGVSVSGQAAYVSRSAVLGSSVTLPDGSQIQDSTFANELTISGSGTVEHCSIAGNISQSGGLVQNTSVTYGSISMGNGQVISNTLTRGGITAGNGSLVQGNNIDNAPGWGIFSSGTVTITQNRLVGNANGIQASGGSVQANLVANSAGVGLEINGDVAVTDNTFTGNGGNTIKIVSGMPTMQGNNLEGNPGTYDIENLTANTIIADNNWWGTTNVTTIDLRIFDYFNEYAYGQVNYLPAAAGPIQTAPAYVRSMMLDPESPVGIETVSFTIGFSKLMESGSPPFLAFTDSNGLTWLDSVDGICGTHIRHMASDLYNNVWVATYNGGSCRHLPNGTWVYYPFNAEYVLPDNQGGAWFALWGSGIAHVLPEGTIQYPTSSIPFVTFIAYDYDGNLLLAGNTGYGQGGIARLYPDGTATIFNANNSPIADAASVEVDQYDNIWVNVPYRGLYQYSPSGTWRLYSPSNSSYLCADGQNGDGFRDSAGDLWWVCGYHGVTRITTIGKWINYTSGNSPLGQVRRITQDLSGNIWFGHGGASKLNLQNEQWVTYTGHPGLCDVHGIAFPNTEDIWFGSYWGCGVSVVHIPQIYHGFYNQDWIDNNIFRASIDITSLIPRGDYRIIVDGAIGIDGIEIAPNTSTTFTVDYIGVFDDTTPPLAPLVTACAGSTAGDLSASWSAYDPESAITLYQYAIGTTPGGAEVINWTYTSATSFDLHGLALTPGQMYYVSVKARNEGGLWSAAATAQGVAAGSDTCVANVIDIFLPLVNK